MVRLAGDGQHTIAGLMRRVKVKATHRVEVRDAKGTVSNAGVSADRQTGEIPASVLGVIYAQEASTPQGRERIDWAEP